MGIDLKKFSPTSNDFLFQLFWFIETMLRAMYSGNENIRLPTDVWIKNRPWFIENEGPLLNIFQSAMMIFSWYFSIRFENTNLKFHTTQKFKNYTITSYSTQFTGIDTIS